MFGRLLHTHDPVAEQYAAGLRAIGISAVAPVGALHDAVLVIGGNITAVHFEFSPQPETHDGAWQANHRVPDERLRTVLLPHLSLRSRAERRWGLGPVSSIDWQGDDSGTRVLGRLRAAPLLAEPELTRFQASEISVHAGQNPPQWTISREVGRARGLVRCPSRAEWAAFEFIARTLLSADLGA